MLGDTIHAIASPPGTASRAVLRISGPRAFEAAALVFAPAVPRHRAAVEGRVTAAGASFEALCLAMPAPASFTGEDVVELHVPGSPLLLELLAQRLGQARDALGLRRALPGEFTRRAFENGRIDLGRAQAILALVHAADAREAAAAAAVLAGAVTGAVQSARAQLQDALALLEAGLDFAEGETGTVEASHWVPHLERAEQALGTLLGQLPRGGGAGELLLVGRANAGKSSLCNALAGRDAVLVSPEGGTTRDLVRVEIAPGVALWDAPGDLAAAEGWDREALRLRDRLAGRAAGVIWVVDPGDAGAVPRGAEIVAVVATRADLGGAFLPPAELASVPWFHVSATRGTGIAGFRSWLLQTRGSAGADALGPLREALDLALGAIARAGGASHAAPELAALELRAGLDALDGIGGNHSPEHLLDRIFGRFCLGK